MGTYIKTFTANLACDVNQPLTKVGEDLTYRIVSPDDLIIDGITATVGDIILFRGQDNSSLNIVAKLNEIVNMGANNWYNFIIPPEFLSINTGDSVYIQSGLVYMNITFRLISSLPFTFDNSEITWEMYGLVSQNGSLANRIGDTREACGATFMQGFPVPINPDLTGKGDGDVTLSNFANTITISASIENPNFIDMGYVIGDEVVVYNNTANFAKYTLTDVSPQILTFAETMPNMAGGNSAICLVPNVSITNDDLALILDTVIGSKIVGYEIVLDSTQDPNIFSPEATTSNILQNCVSVGNGMLFTGNSAYGFNRCSFFNSSSSTGPLKSAVGFESRISNSMTECYVVGSYDNFVGLITGISNDRASQLTTNDCNVVNFKYLGMRYFSTFLSSENDRVKDCDRAIDITFASSGSFSQTILENITVYGFNINQVSSILMDNPTISEKDPAIGIRGIRLARFSVNGGTNTTTTPYDPPVELIPNATGAIGFGY